MRVYIYDERYPKKGKHFKTLKQMRDYCYELYLKGEDGGTYKGKVHINESQPWDLADCLYGSWGRVEYFVGL